MTLIAQLEIAKGLQEDCLRRTAELQERRADPVELSETELQELADLQTAQQRLAVLRERRAKHEGVEMGHGGHSAIGLLHDDKIRSQPGGDQRSFRRVVLRFST